MTVHSIAQRGFGEGTNEVYDRARPSYQPAVLSYIAQNIPAAKDARLNVVELGAGTGIFTRALLTYSQLSSSVAEIRAVEPSKGMRDQFTKTVIGPQGNDDIKITIQDGSFTSTNIPSGWADVVFIAQAYHWAHPSYDAASVEFARILKPSGVVVYVWNLENSDVSTNGAKWVGSLRSLYEKYEGESPQFRLGLWRATFDPEQCPEYAKLFKGPIEETFTWWIPTTVEGVVQRVRTKSYIAILERERKEEYEELERKVREMLDKEEVEKKWIDMEKGVFEYPYKTTVVIARKKE
ncbi:S-adenosyl-L-methionine-dependent methyltransferase [Lentinula raphanica]|uniref:S-adenosyl-L-methionine-dependent methyltransferase n=1 Tax=Lentinula raphanica TaxID=153919 RepID=A0AA38PD29_9AGAR|nr:S-adenosyl-L-methionine-dependent methyltransferase [Lentinula raphanica]KAJ3840683.1 S-adenosyl-L-methionine-dependent methyltransferase [Lentinula raphanica]KAJ3966298.1 S-adenosyl-L-methionine-dependent methyltransferase [Lentinula raphanica]